MRVMSTPSVVTKEFIPPEPEPINPASKRATFSRILKSHTLSKKRRSKIDQQFGMSDNKTGSRYDNSAMTFGEDYQRTFDPHIDTPGVGTYAVQHGSRFTQFYRKSEAAKVDTAHQRFDYQNSNSEISRRQVQVTVHQRGIPPTGTYQPGIAKQKILRRPQTSFCDLTGRKEADRRGDRIHKDRKGAPIADTPAPATYFGADGQLPSAHLTSHPSAFISDTQTPELGAGYSAEVGKYDSTAFHDWHLKGVKEDDTPGGPESLVLAEAHRRSPQPWAKRAATALSPKSVLSPWMGRGRRTAFGFGSGLQRFDDDYDGFLHGGSGDKLRNMMCTLGITTLKDQAGKRQTFHTITKPKCQ